MKVEGAVTDADFAINHYPFNSIEQFVQKHDRYTTYEAAEIFDKYARAKSGEVLYNLTWKPLKMFFKDYVKKKGYKDGTYGLIFCVLFAWSHFLKWAKYWETCEKREAHK